MKEKIKQNGFAFCLTIINLLLLLFALLCAVFSVAPTQDPESTTQTPESTLETQAHRRALKNNFSVEKTTLQELSTDFWYEQTAGILGYAITFDIIDANSLAYYENGSIGFVANPRDNILFYLHYRVNISDYSITTTRSDISYGSTPYSIQSLYVLRYRFAYCSIYLEDNFLIFDMPIYALDLDYDYSQRSLIDIYNYTDSDITLNLGVTSINSDSFLSNTQNYFIGVITNIYEQTIPADEIEQVLRGSMSIVFFKYRNIGDIYQDGVADGNDQGYELGENAVLSNPGQYGLYNQTQYDNAIRDAYNNGVLAGGVDPLEKVWQIISNAGNSVASVFNIQILPGITLGTLFGVFIGIPLLIYILLLLRG